MTKWTAADIPDQSGRTVLITGANSGLGLESAKALAEHGARVLIACRSPERGRQALTQVRAELVELDLASLDSVRRAAEDIRERTGDSLDVLMNNAGVMATPARRTADGFELQLGTNHLGHAALTWLLMPALLGAPQPRVVTVSSLAHRGPGFDLGDLNFERRRYRTWPAYSQSKLANLLFAFELDRRARAAGLDLISVAAHPGFSSTELTANMTRSHGLGWLVAIANAGAGLISQPPWRGALPQLYAATMPDVRGGQYYGPDGAGEMRGYPKLVEPRAAARNADNARALWERTAELTKVAPRPESQTGA